MKIQAQLKSDISKVMVITVLFVLISLYMAFLNDGVASQYCVALSERYDANLHYITSTISGLMAGILGGSTLVYVNQRFFRKKSYGYAMKATILAYTMVFVFIMIVTAFVTSRISLGPEAGYAEILEGASHYMFGRMSLIYYIFWAVITMLTLFFLQIYDKFGSGMFLKFLTGKYHSPREEQRISMFLDMKSSTAIAEKIGSKDYFNLLNDLFTDITDAILSCEGEIYQYVGDEVIVSWSTERGVTQANCLHCFVKIRKRLAGLASSYENKYGVVPTLKAGLHHGLVTAGEIGSMKKDIVYSGDVLNTTSRIQEQCNHYQVDFLVSNETLDLITAPMPFEAVPLGNIELRGKKKGIDLMTIRPLEGSLVA